MIDILSPIQGQSREKIAKDMDRLFYMTPLEAKEYG
jgi:ATP-dependent Clp protease protease subunit